MTMPASGAISMSQVNVELGRAAGAAISFADTAFRAMCVTAGVTGVSAHGVQVGGTDYTNVRLSQAYGRRSWNFQVSGTSPWIGTAPNTHRIVGKAEGVGAMSGSPPSWVICAGMIETEAASTWWNQVNIQAADDGVANVTAAQMRGVYISGPVPIAFGQGRTSDAAGDYVGEGWGDTLMTLHSGTNGPDALPVYKNTCFVVGGTTQLHIFSDG